jgi:hypothetical protein
MHSVVEAELNKERAATLGRAARKIEDAVRRCERLGRAVDAGHAGALAEYREARGEAERAVWQFCVQREAVGLTDHTRVRQQYPLPPER